MDQEMVSPQNGKVAIVTGVASAGPWLNVSPVTVSRS
jgi:hypothetical protein